MSVLYEVLALHKRVHKVFSWSGGFRYEEPCPECDGAPGVHPCGCWADRQIEYTCQECDVEWPCPTVLVIHKHIFIQYKRRHP